MLMAAAEAGALSSIVTRLRLFTRCHDVLLVKRLGCGCVLHSTAHQLRHTMATDKTGTPYLTSSGPISSHMMHFCSIDLTVRIWDGENGPSCSRGSKAKRAGSALVVFSPDGRSFTSASSDRTVWDGETGKLQQTLQ